MFWCLRRWLICSAAILCLAGASPARAGNPMIHQKGIDIVDGHGAKIKLRGVALAPWLHWEGYLFGGKLLTQQSRIIEGLQAVLGKVEADRQISELYRALITKDDIQQIASDGFNCVRVPINYRLFKTDSDIGWAMLDQLSGWCNECHIYMVLDLHDAPGGQSNLPTADPEVPRLSRSKEKQEETVELWRRLALHFKDNTTVAGYDILNEPAEEELRNLIDQDARKETYSVVKLDKSIIKAIRSVDPDHLLIIEGLKLASEFYGFSKPFDDNMMYSFHMYTWFGDDRIKKLALYGDIAHTQHVPMWVGEIGENKYEMIDSTLKMFAASDYIAGWSMWPWKRAKGTFPCLNIVETSANWKAFMDWIANPFRKKPTQQEVVDGLEDFKKAVAIKNTVPDKRLLEILQQY